MEKSIKISPDKTILNTKPKGISGEKIETNIKPWENMKEKGKIMIENEKKTT